jgi:hypothetical protein
MNLTKRRLRIPDCQRRCTSPALKTMSHWMLVSCVDGLPLRREGGSNGALEPLRQLAAMLIPPV